MENQFDFQRFLATYVDTNVPLGSPPSDRHMLNELLHKLLKIDHDIFSVLGPQVLIAICCAIKRGDLAVALFDSVLGGSHASDASIKELFHRTRETINIIWPFVGVPQVIPAALGLVGYLQSKGIQTIEPKRQRADIGPEDNDIGAKTQRSIYKASANTEVFDMLDAFYGDLAHALTTVGFGYNIGHALEMEIPLPEAELILTASLVGLNATRQAGSHIKACIGLGHSESSLNAVIQVADTLVRWQGMNLSPVDVGVLARQARENLAKSNDSKIG